MLKLAFAVALLLTHPAVAADTATFEGCRASWDNGRLTLSNLYIERQYIWRDGRFVATSFRDLESGIEWLAKSTLTPSSPAGLKFSSGTGSASPVQEPSLTLDLVTANSTDYRFRIFPKARGIMAERIEAVTMPGQTPKGAAPESNAAVPSGIETATPPVPKATPTDVLESLTLVPEHIRLTQVTLLDQTDVHNQLVFEREWLPQRNERPIQMDGDLFIAEDTLTHAGLVFLKLAPLPHARPVKDAWDLEAAVKGRTLQCTLAGASYPAIVLAYSGGRAGRSEALQTFQRQLRPYVPTRDGMFLSNTWGDRSRDLRINADFMGKEIDAGSALGVDVIQIDDGWQTGRTANSGRGAGVWNGFWADNPNFWLPDKARFPGGLQPLVKQAAAKGMKFGLWYAPDSSNSFSNWNRDASRLLELHREDKIDYFKIDGVKALTKEGERNLGRMFERVQQETKGAVVFDLDVTAEVRPGYFGMPDVGPLFVENRYTDFHGYWPHQTLRNLWQLSQYVDPRRLRIEVLNNQRNQQQYAGDPLAPSVYPPDYLFATAMFANPLGWFEISNLPAEYRASMAQLVSVWKQHRTEMFRDTTLPVGQPPDGTNWSGFAAFNAERTSGYVLYFRGIGAPLKWREPLTVFGSNAKRIQPLAGDGSVVIDGGELTVQIPQTPGYVWVRVY